ncbi:RluA family pseudouridine synthase [Curvibacter sp. APW13]|uniref:RluA family pseudouridine synthase n=1 Tax=Curvibacter sp. APW13 TaxID=3077236 RepID=UPI0028DE7E76|nr:RluA family pseudouridine synthase [Curvibacter sp. APW13]MDT8991729.1 RluA family pseudouridine synthase [Curvibacter sp. APW13]
MEVGIDGNGVRADKWLTGAISGFSRSYLQQLIDGGAFRVGQVVVRKPSQKLHIGDVVSIELRPTEQSQAFIPQAMDLDVVYEDADLCVINKPAGLVVHPAAGNWTGTLLNGLLARASCFSEVPRSGIVHRLDKDTSGLMVVAKNRASMDRLVAAIAAREVSRIYLALARGPWKGTSTSCSVEAAIGRDTANRLRMAVVDLRLQSGKPARTDLTCLDQTSLAMLVQCKLHTGRTHQIRVHMAYKGWPLLSDAVYGGPAGSVIRRQALHAVRLAFNHPRTGQWMEFFAPIPQDFSAEMESVGLRYNGLSLP